jgi:Matrixin
MAWPVNISQSHAEAAALMVVEGTVVHYYQDVIPGVRPRIVGTHWLLEHDARLIRSTSLGAAIWQAFPQIGFWTLPGDLVACLGTVIRAALVRHENREGYLTLMPYPCAVSAIVRVADQQPLLYQYGQPVTDLPLSFLFAYSLDEPENEINSYQMYFQNSFDILRTATTKISFSEVGTLPPYPPTHYVPVFVDSIPPATAGVAQPLARTFYPLDRAPMKGDRWPQWFNRSYSWAPNPTDNTHYDFISILAHEIGHALGLDHEKGANCTTNPPCLMCPNFNMGPERRTLCADEAGKLRAMYGG